MISSRNLFLISMNVFVWFATGGLFAAEVRMHIVTGSEASPVEQTAARELAHQLEKLFDADVTTGTSYQKGASATFLLGNPKSDKHLRDHWQQDWPALSKEDYLIASASSKHKQGDLVVIAGGSPMAILHAVFETGHHFGIRSLLIEDVYPPKSVTAKLKHIKIHHSPQFSLRSCELLGDASLSTITWSQSDLQQLIRQLSKLKFNRIILNLSPQQPFYHYEFAGIEKSSAQLWKTEGFRIPRDAPGRVAFGTQQKFEHPDFRGLTSYRDKLSAGKKLINGLITTAHRYGMQVVVSISPLEYAPEFAKHFSQSDFDSAKPHWAGLLEQKLQAIVQTYPQLDAIALRLTPAESPKTVKSFTDNQLKQLLKANTRLATNAKPVPLILSHADPKLFAGINQLPSHFSELIIQSNTPIKEKGSQSGNAANLPGISHSQMLTVSSNRMKGLPQSHLHEIHHRLNAARTSKLKGFVVSASQPAEIEPTFYYLSRTAYDPKTTDRQAHDSFFTGLTNNQSVADRMWLGLGHLEKAANLVAEHSRGEQSLLPKSPAPLMQKFEPPAWWKLVSDEYNQWVVEAYRSHGPTPKHAKPLLFYYAKRSEYASGYLAAMQALPEIAAATKSEDYDLALEKMDAAVESLYNAIDTLGDVARTQSDRALISILLQDAYLPLIQSYEKLSEQADAVQ